MFGSDSILDDPNAFLPGNSKGRHIWRPFFMLNGWASDASDALALMVDNTPELMVTLCQVDLNHL